MKWPYHIISLFLKPPTHPPPTDDPDSFFIEKFEVIGNELAQLPTKPASLAHLQPNSPSSTMKRLCLFLQEGMFLLFCLSLVLSVTLLHDLFMVSFSSHISLFIESSPSSQTCSNISPLLILVFFFSYNLFQFCPIFLFYFITKFLSTKSTSTSCLYATHCST